MNTIMVPDAQIRGSPLPSPPLADRHPLRPSAEAAGREQDVLGWDGELPPQEVEQAAEGVNAFLKSSDSHVQFAYYEEAKRMVVQVVDDRTQEVIKTIPAKELLELAAKIGEMVGVLLDEKG